MFGGFTIDSLFRSIEDFGGYSKKRPINYYSFSDKLIMKMVLPAVKKEDLTVINKNNVLIIKATKYSTAEKEYKNVALDFNDKEAQIHQEIRFPEVWDLKKASGKLEDGILEITIPAKTNSEPEQQISIN